MPTLTAGQSVCFLQSHIMQLAVNFSSHWPFALLDRIVALFSALEIKQNSSARNVTRECAAVSILKTVTQNLNCDVSRHLFCQVSYSTPVGKQQ